MNAMKTGSTVALAILFTGIAVVLSGCYGIPKDTLKVAKIGNIQITAVGAGIVEADAVNTTIKVKCGFCGFEDKEVIIPSPVAGKPYTMEWICPKCGHKQSIIVQVDA